MIVLYVKHLRPLFVKKEAKELFVTRSGYEFDGPIGKRVTAWWRKARGKKVTSTALRKMTASTLHDADTVDMDKRKVHKHMCHKESTADKYYMTAARTRVALQSHQIIRCNLGLDNEEKEKVKEQEEQKKEERKKQGQKEEEQESEEQEGQGQEEKEQQDSKEQEEQG